MPVLHSLAACHPDSFCQANGHASMTCPAPYYSLEPIFDGRFIKLPFFKAAFCPGTFVLFNGGEQTFSDVAVRLIITSTPIGDIIINLFQAPPIEMDSFGPLNDPHLDNLPEVSLLTS